MSYFDEVDSENRERKKNRFRESLISRIEDFEGFRANKILRTEASSLYHISRKGLKFAKSRNFTLLR